LLAWRDEAGADQAVPEQFDDPLRIAHVGLAPGDGLDVLRIA